MTNPPPHLLPMASHGCSCCGPASRADTASIPAASDSSTGGSSPSYQVTGLTLAEQIINDQEAEIAQMQQMLTAL